MSNSQIENNSLEIRLTPRLLKTKKILNKTSKTILYYPSTLASFVTYKS
jgi:hypothetical protein